MLELLASTQNGSLILTSVELGLLGDEKPSVVLGTLRRLEHGGQVERVRKTEKDRPIWAWRRLT